MTLLCTPRRSSLSSTLVGHHVVLEPLHRRDLPDIAATSDDPAFELLLRRFTGSPRAARAWMRHALRGMRSRREVCWTIRRRDTGELIGSTRFLNVDLANARLEVGATWLVAAERGGPANAESKLLVLTHAFEQLGVRRVHIQADVRNARSRAAIEALGAGYEGVLRQHIVLPDGTSRDTAVYSITSGDWDACRARIEARVAAKLATEPVVIAALEPVDVIEPAAEPLEPAAAGAAAWLAPGTAISA